MPLVGIAGIRAAQQFRQAAQSSKGTVAEKAVESAPKKSRSNMRVQVGGEWKKVLVLGVDPWTDEYYIPE